MVIAVRDSRELLGRCLAALQSSDYDAFECIVVDDASIAPAADIVSKFGFRSIRSDQQVGPAAARNLGVKCAAGDILFFTDADVEVRPDTLSRVTELFDADEELTAVIGSYDDAPGEPDFFSQYRNLLHHFVHQHANQQASTFWSACGAVRKGVFDALGGFSPNYKRPAVEDIEFGGRVRDAGGRILLDKTLQVKHLKKWGLRSIVITDLRDRGFPWALLLAARREMPRDLNVSINQRFSVALSCAGLLAWFFGLVEWGGLYYAPAAAALLTAFVGPALYNLLSKHGPGVSRIVAGGFGAMFMSGMAGGLLLVANQPPGAFAASAMGIVAVLNRGTFQFFYRSRGPLFAASVAPYYLLHQVGNGLSFGAAQLVHAWRGLLQAFRQVIEQRAPADR